MAQFFRMPPCAVPARPFYVVVLAPSSQTFDQLVAKLRESLHPEGTFLIAGNVQPVTIESPRVFARAGEQKADFYGANPQLQWLMFDQGGPPPREIAVGYSVAPEFPAARLSWAVKAESRTLEKFRIRRGLGTCRLEDPRSRRELEDLPGRSAAGPPALLWSGFDREIADLQASFGHIRSLGRHRHRHSAAVKDIEALAAYDRRFRPLLLPIT